MILRVNPIYKFCPNLTILVSLESWRYFLFKFGKTKFDSKTTNLPKSPKFVFRVKDQKFAFELGLRIWNFRFSRKLFKFWQKNKIPPRMVYHNFANITQIRKSKFSKIGQNILRNNPYKLFSKFWSRIFKIPKSPKLAQNNSPKFWRKFLNPDIIVRERFGIDEFLTFCVRAVLIQILKKNFPQNFAILRQFLITKIWIDNLSN